MQPVPAAPDIRPGWRRLAPLPWAWFRRRPGWVQVVGWILGFWILPAAWLLARARGPVGLGAAALAAVVGVVVVAAAGDGGPAKSTPTAATSPPPVVVEVSPTPDPTRSAPPPTRGPDAEPSPTPTAAPTPTPSSAPSPPPAPSLRPTPLPSPAADPSGDDPDGDGAGGTGPDEPDATRHDGRLTTVERIVDGDTLYLAGLPERARLIGIDTPETVAPNTPVQCFGPEASAHLAALVPPGTRVEVVHDVERVDRYDRPLVYLYRTSDGLFVNRAMVGAGFAQVDTHPPNVAHVEAFVAAQRRAREDGRGLWSTRCDEAAPSDVPTPATKPPTTGGGSGGSSGGDVAIVDVVYDTPGNDVEFDTSEQVVLANRSDGRVDLGGWTLTDLADHVITIPDGATIAAGGRFRVHTGPGDDTSTSHHHGAGQAIWNNSGGDTATLRDAGGQVVAEFSYDS